MKKILTIIAVAVACCACSSSDSVNILITNESRHDTTQVTVRVPMQEIMKHLNVQMTDTVYLLNEKNTPVGYRRVNNRQDIEFVVPVINAFSQKNYSLYKDKNKLEDNLFTFRAASINISVK